jgi:diguanylate cyclase (GGDEF)-like protein
MGLEPTQDAIDAVDLEGAPLAVDAALRKVRLVTALLVAVRLVTSQTMPLWQIATLVVAFLTVNLIARASREDAASTRTALAIVQLSADTFVVLLVTCLQHSNADTADWAILVLPVIEGAILFQMRGAIVTWSAIAAGYAGWALFLNHDLSAAMVAQRLAIVLLVSLPSGFLAENLVAEIAAHRRGRLEAERRGSLLRAAAFSGRRSTTLDVDEILDVLRDTVAEMGFAEPQVFELSGDAPLRLTARPVRQSRDVFAIPPGDQRLIAADRARAAGASVLWPPDGEPGAGVSKLFAVPVTSTETGDIMLAARWPGPGLPPESQTESIELFAAQAGASLRNAHVYLELQTLKDRLAHEASHDALTDLPNRRRFHEQLERMCGRGRAGDTLAVLFLDLDGFKHVNDRFGHDVGNELLVRVAGRLLSCVRPGDVVARMGGDEFVIMLTRIENAAPAIEVADRVCELLADPFDFESGEVRISTSVGIALAPADTADPGDLVRRADGAMYRAKSQGKAGWAMDPGSLSPSS